MRILFVARPISVHAARWINQIADQGWDIHLFSAFENPLHADFKNLTAYNVSTQRLGTLDQSVHMRGIWPMGRGNSIIRGAIRQLPSQWSERAAWLARLIRWLKPDIVHSLEFQLAGYLTLRARDFYEGQFPPWIATNWGSDIYLYGPLSEHTEKIKSVLAHCDYYSCECHRDVALAQEYGFKGEVLPVLPIAGGIEVEQMQQYRDPGPTSSRRLIALKGYQHWAGRSLFGLRAIELCADLLKEKGYRVAVYLAEADVRIAAERMAWQTGIPVDIIPPSTHADMLRLHGRARVSIGVSISDGLSTSALESIAMGSFPIQSNTSCLDEMLREGEHVLMVPPEDPEAIAAAIRRAVTDDALVDRAAALNTQMAFERLSSSVIKPQVIEMYQRIAGHSRAKLLANAR